MAQPLVIEETEEKAVEPLPKQAAAMAWGAFALTVLLAILSIYSQKPPNIVPADAAATVFSSGRALRHVQAISRNIHPIGSLEHAAARDYIFNELTSMGLAPEVQETTVVAANRGVPYRTATVRNILARLKGTGPGKAVLLVSHYDSVPTGPGASDDAAAVAALLETLRALKAGEPLKNDLILLFTDGEEAGLLGAKAFIEEHPWAKDVGVVLNFEARGHKGPSYMFETSNQNGWLIDEFAGAAPHPIANSLAFEIYRLLPNDTDMTVFKEAGLDGLNFAFIDGSTKYHTRLDNLESLDERSLQHHGTYALALARRFGNLDLPGQKQSNAIYFNAFGSLLFHYPGGWVLPLAILVLILFAAVVMLGFKKRRVTIKGVALGALALLLGAIAAIGIVTVAWWLIRRLTGSDAWLLTGDNAYNAGSYLLGFAALSVAVTAAIYLWFSRRIDSMSLILGSLVWWAISMLATALYLPGGSYLFTWPLLFALLGVLVALLFPRLGYAKLLAVLTLCIIPGVLLMAPTIHSLGVALALSYPAALQLPLILLLGLLVPQLYALVKFSGWALPCLAAALGLGLILYSGLTFKFDKDHPRQDNLFYILNADSGKAIWVSTDRQLDKWTSQFFSAGESRGEIEEYLPTKFDGFLRQEAPASAFTGPRVEVLEDQTVDGARRMRLRLASTRQAPVLSIYAEVATSDLKATVNGKRIGNLEAPTPVDAGHPWGFIYSAVPSGGLELTLEMRPAQPLKLTVVERSYGLPQLPQPSTIYPEDVVPMPYGLSDSTFVTKKFVF